MIERFPRRGGRWQLVPAYVSSLYHGRRQRGRFADVERYCMFIGYPHSGHSVVGSLLDAHPEMAIAHELDALAFLQAGFRRDQIYALIVNNARSVVQNDREQTGYSYLVPGAWQGTFERLRVIGDKKGGKSTYRLAQRPDLIRRIGRALGARVTVIHVVRNPYDNIAAISRRRGVSLERSIEWYFSLADTVAEIKQSAADGEVMDVSHDALIADPAAVLTDLCHALGVEPHPEYLEKCSTIVFRAPQRKRREVEWTPRQIDDVRRGMDRHAFLAPYGWES